MAKTARGLSPFFPVSLSSVLHKFIKLVPGLQDRIIIMFYSNVGNNLLLYKVKQISLQFS